MPGAHHGTVGVGHLGHVVRGPALPLAGGGIARLEHETAVVGEGGPDRGERGPQFVVADKDLKRVAGHHDQVELTVPADRFKVSENALDIRPPACLAEHRLGRIEPAQPPLVTSVPCPVQQLARPAADIEHRTRGHHQGQVEVEVVPPRAQSVIQLGERRLGEQAVGHHACLPGDFGNRD